MRRVTGGATAAAIAALLGGCGGGGSAGTGTGAPASGAATAAVPGSAHLDGIGPPHVSNQTAYPVMLYGDGFQPGCTVVIPGAAAPLATAFVDARHLGAIVPAGLVVPAGKSTVALDVHLIAPDGVALPGAATLTVVDDVGFAVPAALELSGDGARAFVASPTTDELWVFPRDGTPVSAVKVGDGPRALARWRDAAGAEWIVVAHEYAAELRLVPAAAPAGPQVVIPVSASAEGVAVDGARGRAYLTNHRLDRVEIVDLAARKVTGTLPAGIDPRPLALGEGGKLLVVGNPSSADVSLIDVVAGTERRAAPAPGIPILGGHTAPYAKYVMGGSAARAIAYSDALHVAFVADLGPNIGPNPDRMEIAQNGGVEVVDPATGSFRRHVSMLKGVPAALALDDARGLLYAADLATGRLVAFDATALAAPDAATAAAAIRATLELAPPADTELVRPASDFGIDGRAGVSLHTGPVDLRLSADGATLFVLERFAGLIAEVDVRSAAAGTLAVTHVWPGPDLGKKRLRRLGEILYYTDLSNSRMTCDTCHPQDGPGGGLLFSKGRPIRIYRAPSMRVMPVSPPYFTPSRLPSLFITARDVLARNRFHNPDPLRAELVAVSEFTEAAVPPPNPYVGAGGALPRDLALPDGAHGDPVAGLALFEGKGGCADAACHPPPAFTADQSPATRGVLMDVGTPIALPLRTEMQDMIMTGMPPPSLLGVWDTFPLLLSGAGGFDVTPEGTLRAAWPFALRRVLEYPGTKPHGSAAALTPQERDNLLAYLLTL